MRWLFIDWVLEQSEKVPFPDIGDDMDLQFLADHFVDVGEHVLKDILGDRTIFGMVEDGLEYFYNIGVFGLEEVFEVIEGNVMVVERAYELTDGEGFFHLFVNGTETSEGLDQIIVIRL